MIVSLNEALDEKVVRRMAHNQVVHIQTLKKVRTKNSTKPQFFVLCGSTQTLSHFLPEEGRDCKICLRQMNYIEGVVAA